MPIPTRPVSGAVIGSVWGIGVHDFTFAPAGCILSGGDVAMLAAQAYRDLPIVTADEDPGGYLDAANLRAEVPADGEGLYLIVLRVNSDDGAATDETSVILRVNGVEAGRATAGNEGATDVTLELTLIEPLSVGDQISVRARQLGVGDRADVRVRSLSMVRLGYELGSPT